MESVKDIKQSIKKLTVESSDQIHGRVLDKLLRVLDKSKKQPAATQPNIWRIIMKTKITKLAAVAAIMIALYVLLQIPSGLLPTAYALEDTIEAYNSIRWLHVKEFYMLGQEKRTSELWIECDDYGRLSKFRLDAPNSGGPMLGPLTVVNDGNGSDAWLPNFNLCFRTSGKPDDASVLLQWEISEIDPKLVCERLYEQERQGEIILDINEPDQKNEPIVLVVTYPAESLSANWKKLLYIDQATRLVKKAEKFEMRDGQYQHVRTVEFFDYNQQIDPEMFSLEGELPEDVIWVDQSDKEIGLAQGDMTDEEIAVELARQFFEAYIAEDYDKAGLLYCGVPGFVIERLNMGTKAIEITAIGQTHTDTDPDTNAMISSCKVLAEFGGQMYELDAKMIRVISVSGQPDRWMICGTSIYSNPAPGKLTLSTEGADPSAVTYDGLVPGEFMRKWLVLGPLPYPVQEGIYFATEEGQKVAFDTENVDFVNFTPKVTIEGADYEWAILEAEYNSIDLTQLHETENVFNIVYVSAQIEMPEGREAVLGIGSDDGVKVWLNGELVHENWLYRGVVSDNDRVPVNFKKGTNQLVLKIQNALGPWGFCCRLLDE